MPGDLLSNLDKTPSRSAAFLWADYIELRCLIHPDQYFSLDGAEEALHEAEDYQADAEVRIDTTVNSDLDKLEVRWQECEQIISRRATLFGDAYPFVPATHYRGIEVNPDVAPPIQNWYRFLLLSSSLQYVRNHNALTGAFERASLVVFQQLTPAGSEVHGFWPGAHHYPNDKAGRITKLAQDLRTCPTFPDNAFNQGDRGDAGIDLVAWHPMGDLRDRMPFALGQCGCSTEEWKTKPNSVSRNSLCHKFFIGHDFWQFYFMPLDLHGPAGKWADGTGDLPGVIVVDRSRFIGLARIHNLLLPAEAAAFVEELNGFRYR